MRQKVGVGIDELDFVTYRNSYNYCEITIDGTNLVEGQKYQAIFESLNTLSNFDDEHILKTDKFWINVIKDNSASNIPVVPIDSD